ncbi:hypothetical protein FB451DRAFT_1405472 [Mycena latifolia]|nr:hypothetical protein FB451DRAFT_1405472 [Mycena latifolia]
MQSASWIDAATRQTSDRNLCRFLRNAFPDAGMKNDDQQVLKTFKSTTDLIVSTSTWITTLLPSGGSSLLFSVRLPSGKDEDVALVQMFKRSSFKPRTIWENCRILEDGKTMFVLPRYFVRGAHFINAFGAPGSKVETTFYLNDVVDFDWFLQAGN